MNSKVFKNYASWGVLPPLGQPWYSSHTQVKHHAQSIGHLVQRKTHPLTKKLCTTWVTILSLDVSAFPLQVQRVLCHII